MPPVRFLAFKCAAYYFKLVAVILLLGEIIPTYSCYIEKGLVYIAIIALSSRQPSFYIECTKLNMRSSCDIRLVSIVKYAFFMRFCVL